MARFIEERRETTTAGQAVRVLFWIWQGLMGLWLVSYLAQAGGLLQTPDRYARAGATIGIMMSAGFIGIIWIIGSVVLGGLMLATRGRKFLVEHDWPQPSPDDITFTARVKPYPNWVWFVLSALGTGLVLWLLLAPARKDVMRPVSASPAARPAEAAPPVADDGPRVRANADGSILATGRWPGSQEECRTAATGEIKATIGAIEDGSASALVPEAAWAALDQGGKVRVVKRIECALIAPGGRLDLLTISSAERGVPLAMLLQGIITLL